MAHTHSAGRFYFGVRVEFVEGMKFAESHVSPTEVLRSMKTSPERFRPIIEECRRILVLPD